MTGSQVATTHGSALTLVPDQEFWNEKQLAALRQLGVERASNGDLAVFMHVAQKTGLDPFARQIYLIQRDGKQTIQTGIDGFRLVARRAVDQTGESLAIGPSEWADEDGVWTDVWLKDTPPAAARVIVKRDGHEFPGVALWREYVQRKRDGKVTSMWIQRPAGQLAKCAEALALRKAFPQDLAGIYTDDEMASTPQRSRTESAGLGAVLEPDEVAEGELVIEPEEEHDYVNDPESGTCRVVFSDGSVCGELESRPPHTGAGPAPADPEKT